MPKEVLNVLLLHSFQILIYAMERTWGIPPLAGHGITVKHLLPGWKFSSPVNAPPNVRFTAAASAAALSTDTAESPVLVKSNCLPSSGGHVWRSFHFRLASANGGRWTAGLGGGVCWTGRAAGPVGECCLGVLHTCRVGGCSTRTERWRPAIGVGTTWTRRGCERNAATLWIKLEKKTFKTSIMIFEELRRLCSTLSTYKLSYVTLAVLWNAERGV